MQSKKTHKIKVNALFHRLQINKNIKFQTRICWKRHTNKGQTRLVSHQHGYSTFQQNITLEFNLVYDQAKGIYQDKNTEIVAVISYEGKIKSGGYAKYNIAQVINKQLSGQMVAIPLSQCPDPNANVQVTFTFALEQEGFSEVASVLNASSLDLNMSRVDFHDDKISLQMDRINATIIKLDELAQSIKTKQKSSLQKVPQLTKKSHQLEGQNKTLKNNIKQLQQKLQQKDRQERDRAKNDQKTIIALERQLQKRSKQFKSKEFQDIDEDKKMQEDFKKKDRQVARYKAKLEEAQEELQELRGKSSRPSNSNDDDLDRLKNENNTLKNDLAASSFKLAQLFNAAYDYGDSKLLDHLQAAIGLIE